VSDCRPPPTDKRSTMKYFTMRSSHSFPATLQDSELIFDWSQFPSEMLSLCEPVHELLTKLDLTGIDEDWERSALLKNGFCFPTQRIPLKQGIDEERQSVINRFFTNLISGPNSSMDLFDPIEKDYNDFPDLGSILERTRSELGGRLIASPITIQHETETLEISGRIRPPSKNTPEFSKDLMKTTGFIDSPSLWNNTVEVKTNSGDQKGKRVTLHISVDQNLTLLQEAQKSQRPCAIAFREELDARRKIIKKIVSIEYIDENL